MRVFDEYAEATFFQDSEGRTVHFPKAIGDDCYIVDTNERHRALAFHVVISRFVSWWLLVAQLILNDLVFDSIYLLAFLVASMGYWLWWDTRRAKKVRAGLRAGDHRASTRDRIRNAAAKYSWLTILLLMTEVATSIACLKLVLDMPNWIVWLPSIVGAYYVCIAVTKLRMDKDYAGPVLQTLITEE